MKIRATSTQTSQGPATVLHLAGARSVWPREALEHLLEISPMVPSGHGVIITGACRREVESAIARASPGVWVARHQPKLEEAQARIFWPLDLADTIVSFQLEAEAICPECQSDPVKNGSNRGRQQWLCTSCGHGWLGEAA